MLEVLDRTPYFAAETEQPTGTPVPWEPSFIRLLHEVEAIYEGTMDYAKGGLYFCDLRRIETAFFRDKILDDKESHPRVVDMNTLVVFK
jgi:hypothetical protein